MTRLYGTRHLTARSQARELLALGTRETWNCAELPPLGQLPGGKPWFPSHPDWHFNLSHSGTLALCALSDAPVGADIQIVKSTWRESLLSRTCSEEQLAWLNKQEDRFHAFTMLWAMKESRVKWDGSGLTSSIAAIPVPLPEKGAGLYTLDGLWFRVYARPDWCACLCGEDLPPEDICWR